MLNNERPAYARDDRAQAGAIRENSAKLRLTH